MQVHGETNIYVIDVEAEGMAAKCGIKFGMVLAKVGTKVVRSSERAFDLLKMRSDSTTTTFRLYRGEHHGSGESENSGTVRSAD
jgi:hypothetical protein